MSSRLKAKVKSLQRKNFRDKPSSNRDDSSKFGKPKRNFEGKSSDEKESSFGKNGKEKHASRKFVKKSSPGNNSKINKTKPWYKKKQTRRRQKTVVKNALLKIKIIN